MKMNDYLITELFPIPLYKKSLNRNFKKEELNFVKKTRNNIIVNRGNSFSKNTDILNEKLFTNLKKELDLMIKEYFYNTLNVSKHILPFITQSWLNFTEKNQHHHEHHHPNSIVSGVIYLNADEQKDKITFSRRERTMIELDYEILNKFNAPFWDFPIKTGDVILFPSTLGHMVTISTSDDTRISLAFNVFIKGILGNNNISLKKLILK